MRTLTVATTNRHKAREIAEILEPLGFEILSPDDLPEVVEDGATFAENARKKAVESAAFLGVPALADDSGLVVEVLDGAPGIRSARFAGPSATSADNNALLIERLEALGVVDPKAAFVCHAVVADPDGRIVAEATGRVEGVLRWPGAGGGGFGYDPLFHHPPSDCRFSELPPGRKNEVSHRGRALRALAAALADA